ncbi:MAG TPA: DUF4115 domain-containing protein, partial [Thermoanaerobaculia bacterium]
PAPASAVIPETAANGSGSSNTLTLEFEQDSWTKIDADGETVLQGLVRQGELRRFQARDGFRLTLGNAGGVRVSLDGRALDPLGRAGQVVRDVKLPTSTRG